MNGRDTKSLGSGALKGFSWRIQSDPQDPQDQPNIFTWQCCACGAYPKSYQIDAQTYLAWYCSHRYHCPHSTEQMSATHTFTAD